MSGSSQGGSYLQSQHAGGKDYVSNTSLGLHSESFPLQKGVGVENQYDQEEKDWKKRKLSQSKF